MQTIEWTLGGKKCPVHVAGDISHRKAPAVLLFMDAFGPRPALFRIAEQIAADGYRTFLPDLFYRELPYRPLDPRSLFTGGKERHRLASLLAGSDQAALDADVAGLLDMCREYSEGEARIGVTGYCMGGRYALTAASLALDVRAAACFHSTNLAPIEGPSAHSRLSGTNARIYVGIAEVDPTFDAQEEGRLAEALRRARTAHVIESYPGTQHGFVMDDLPVHSPAAADRHRRQLQRLFAEALGEQRAT